MAKIKIRKVVKEIDLDEYYGSGESEIIKVWVNPPKALRDQYNEAREESQAIIKALAEVSEDDKDELKALGKRLHESAAITLDFWSVIWSQGKDKSTHWTPDDVAELQRDCNEHDPGLWSFVATMSIGLMNDYVSGKAKKGKRR